MDKKYYRNWRKRLRKIMKLERLKVIPRRLLDDDNPDGYLESDKDFVLNNIETCVVFLERKTDANRRESSPSVTD